MLLRPHYCGMHRLCRKRAATTTAAAFVVITTINHHSTTLTSYCQSTPHTPNHLHTSSLLPSPTTWSSAPPTSTPRPATVHSNVNSPLLQLLSRQSRGIPAKGADIDIIDTPTAFHTTLLTLVSTATQHITLSSLYLGTGPLEQQLVTAILKRCHEQPQLKVHILLDYYRATRAVDTAGSSSVTALTPLLALNTPTQQRVALSLFQPPVRRFAGWADVLFRGRWRELRGVHHMKYYVVDDTAVLSGANLSDTYFTNRQDRYIVFRRNAALVDWLHQLTNTLTSSQFTHTITTTAATTSTLTQPNSHGSNAQQLRERLMALVRPTDEDGQVGMNAAHATLMPTIDTWLFPALQLGMVGVREEENIVTRIIKLTALTAFAPHSPLLHARQQPTTPPTSPASSASASASVSSAPPSPLTVSTVPCLSIATGYMNLPSLYTNALLSSVTPVQLLSSAESANGWHGAKGIAVHVPRLYSAVLYQFLRDMAAGGGSGSVEVREWQCDGWSYHVKGMWLSMGGGGAGSGVKSSQGEAVLSVVGSTNFGLRSMERDAECSLVIVTKGGSGEGSLAQRLGAERDRLWSNGVPVTVDTFEREGSERRLPWLIRWVAKFAREYL